MLSASDKLNGVVPLTAFRWHRNLLLATDIFRRHRLSFIVIVRVIVRVRVSVIVSVYLHHLLNVAFKNYFAAIDASVWSNVDDMVGAANYLLVVFNHDDGVADVA